MGIEALRLYKDLLRYSQQLKFTDKKYFVHRIRKEFLKNRPLEDPQEIRFQIEKGQQLLKSKRVI